MNCDYCGDTAKYILNKNSLMPNVKVKYCEYHKYRFSKWDMNYQGKIEKV